MTPSKFVLSAKATNEQDDGSIIFSTWEDNTSSKKLLYSFGNK